MKWLSRLFRRPPVQLEDDPHIYDEWNAIKDEFGYPRHRVCDACETCAHCLKNGCIPVTKEKA